VSVSGGGALVYQAGGPQQWQLAWFDRGGKPLGNLGPPGAARPEISPDGKRVSVDALEDVWIYDIARGNATRFTPNGANSTKWATDGNRIVYASGRKGKWELYMKPVGGGAEQSLLTTGMDKNPDDWSSDGRVIVFETYDSRSKLDLWWLPLDGDRKPV